MPPQMISLKRRTPGSQCKTSPCRFVGVCSPYGIGMVAPALQCKGGIHGSFLEIIIKRLAMDIAPLMLDHFLSPWVIQRNA